jgi:hypothetical protein
MPVVLKTGVIPVPTPPCVAGEHDVTPYIVEGYLDLAVQEGGYAADEFNLDPLLPTTVGPYTAPWFRGETTEYQLSEAVAQYFGAARRRGGNRYIGKVRITIESLE